MMQNLNKNKWNEILLLNLDHYSDFIALYEEGIRFYTNSKDIVFKLNIRPNASGGSTVIETIQGENDIYFFCLWTGYFSTLMSHLINDYLYSDLPQFIKNWNEVKGWNLDEYAELISDVELEWLIIKIIEILPSYKTSEGDYKCLSDLVLFLKYVKENNLELRISEY